MARLRYEGFADRLTLNGRELGYGDEFEVADDDDATYAVLMALRREGHRFAVVEVESPITPVEAEPVAPASIDEVPEAVFATRSRKGKTTPASTSAADAPADDPTE